MAKIIYALSGQGRGHSSRVLAVSDELRHRGHELVFCCGGQARDILESEGESVIAVPALRQVMEGNEVQLLRTAQCNWDHLTHLRSTISDLADVFNDHRADLLITDFEAFSPRAADRIGLPVLSFNHQQVVTETEYELPAAYWWDAFITSTVIRFITPSKPEHILVTSFFFPPLKRPETTTLVAPIIRPAVAATEAAPGNHVLVYFNQTEGTDHILDELREVDAEFVVYNFPEPENLADYPNMVFKKPSLDEFLADLATSRAVLCTAGFTLTSEALFLGKPLMVIPNRGIFEQALNAIFLEREGLGKAVLGGHMSREDVESFLQACDRYREHLQGRKTSGNVDAVNCIESVLGRSRKVVGVPSNGFPNASRKTDEVVPFAKSS